MFFKNENAVVLFLVPMFASQTFLWEIPARFGAPRHLRLWAGLSAKFSRLWNEMNLVRRGSPGSRLNWWIEHLDYMLKHVGEDGIGFGFDSDVAIGYVCWDKPGKRPLHREPARPSGPARQQLEQMYPASKIARA